MAGDGITAGRQRSRANGSATGGGLRVERVWTTEGVHPYDEVEWERRDVVMTNWRDGSINFEQEIAILRDSREDSELSSESTESGVLRIFDAAEVAHQGEQHD